MATVPSWFLTTVVPSEFPENSWKNENVKFVESMDKKKKKTNGKLK